MSRTRALTATAALMLLPALTLAGCRAGEQTSRAAASPAPIQEANRPPEGTNWTTDAPPPVTGAAGVAAPDDGSSARERALADREAAVAQREADVARREQTASVAPRIAAPRHTTTTTRHTTSRRTTAPAPAPSRTEIASRHEEPAPAPAPVERREPERVTVPAGTNLAAEVTNGASSATAQVGDGVSARVAQDVYAGGQLAIPAGSRLSGTVTDVQGLRRVGGQARLAVRFDSVELPNGTRAPIYASWSSTGRNETRRDAATIGGGAAGGAVLGRVLGGSRHRDEHTAKGAVVGAVLGTVIAARNQRGAQVELPEGSTVDLTLADSVRVTVGR